MTENTAIATGAHTTINAGRVDALHRLGTTVEGGVSALEAMKIAGLTDWNVRKLPLFATSDIDGSTLDIHAKFATVYTSPNTGRATQLGVVGSTYVPIQNETHADLLDTLVDEAGAKIETLGTLRGGAQTFISMKMPETMMIGGKDAVDLYLVAFNSHDGTSAFHFAVTPVRVACANQLNAAMREAKSTFSIRHTSSSDSRIQEAREALDLTFAYVAEFEAEAERMIEQSMTDAMFARMTLNLFPESSSTRAANTNEAHRDALTALWHDSATLEGVRGNRWAAYNTVTEYADHFVGTRGKRDVADARATRTVLAKSVTRLKNRSFALLSA